MTMVVILLIAAAAVGGAGVRADRTAGDLRGEASVAKATFQAREAVGVTMTVTNISGSPVTITSGGQQYDVVVRRRGALVWQWSHDKGFAQVLRSVEMAPGATRTYQASWDQRDLQGRPVEAGPYDIFCTLMASQRNGPPNIEIGPLRVVVGR
jgi:Intracellular proteinase inhibitor